MKFVFLIFAALSLNLFADNNLTSQEAKKVAKSINSEATSNWTKGYLEVQFDYVTCPSDKSQCAFTFKMWPTSSEVETLEGSYNGRGKGFYWSAKVLQRGLVTAKCTVANLETLEDILTTNGDVRAEVLSKLEDCVGKVSKVSAK